MVRVQRAFLATSSDQYKYEAVRSRYPLLTEFEQESADTGRNIQTSDLCRFFIIVNLLHTLDHLSFEFSPLLTVYYQICKTQKNKIVLAILQVDFLILAR